MVEIKEKDIKLYTSASHGFRGFFDENADDNYPQEMYDEARDWTDVWLDKIYRAKNLEDFIKGIPSKVPYSLEINENSIYFYWTCPNGLNGEYTFGFDVEFGEIR